MPQQPTYAAIARRAPAIHTSGAPQTASADMPETPCPRCGGQHWLSKCSQPRGLQGPCFHCRKVGHKKRDCPQLGNHALDTFVPGQSDKTKPRKKRQGLQLPEAEFDALATSVQLSFEAWTERNASHNLLSDAAAARFTAVEDQVEQDKQNLATAMAQHGQTEEAAYDLINEAVEQLSNLWTSAPSSTHKSLRQSLRQFLSQLASNNADPTNRHPSQTASDAGLHED